MPSGKARYYPLSGKYRETIQEKIVASFRISASLPRPLVAQFSPSSFQHEDPRNGRWFFGDNPSDLLMSLQP
jgi:hypothetical protein